jgi:RNA polymerase primary sigma factor
VVSSSIGEPAKDPFGIGHPGGHQAQSEPRVRQTLGLKIAFVPHPCFDDPAMQAEIVGPMPGVARLNNVIARSSNYQIPIPKPDFEEFPLLTAEQERHLFRKMNFLYHRASQLQRTIDPATADTADLDLFLAVWKEAEEIKERIIQSNMRLVFALVRKLLRPGQDFFDLVSDANLALIRASERFDFSRGYKFSTYAGWSIMNACSRVSPRERFRRDRLLTGHERNFETLADYRPDPRQREKDLERNRDLIRELLGRLSERE